MVPPACLDHDPHVTMIVDTTEGMTVDMIVMMIEKENTTGLTGMKDVNMRNIVLVAFCFPYVRILACVSLKGYS